MNVDRRARLTGLLMLYGSRLASVVVSLLFVPFYASQLGPHAFGQVALIVSAQALIVMLDLGMAALTTRDLAAEPDMGRALAAWQAAERLLSLAFGLLALPALALAAWLGWPLLLGVAILGLFWAVTLQNLTQAAMVARGDVQRAAALQGGGMLLRALLTAAVLAWLEASLRGFLLSQCAGALLHMAVNRHLGQRELGPARLEKLELPGLARRGLPLFLVGVAGAAVLQADKLLVGVLMSPAAVAPYFLATTFCLTPVAILAAPVAQFFQPQIIGAHEQPALLQRRTHQLTLTLLATVALPTALLWVTREPLIRLWLRDAGLVGEVGALSAVMLPAAAIGAVGNVPLALLNARADFGFQARLSGTLTVLTLIGVALAAAHQRLQAVCWVYMVYYTVLTVLLWWRAAQHSATGPAARRSALLTAGICLIVSASVVLLPSR